MRELVMDAASWKTKDDLYLSFFRAVGAPAWHGKNLDALRDSVGAGQINRIEVPYRLVLKNYARVRPAVRADAEDFIDVIRTLAAEGVPVEIRTDIAN
jgi:RNAse (barnase) inhibitor barstar